MKCRLLEQGHFEPTQVCMLTYISEVEKVKEKLAAQTCP